MKNLIVEISQFKLASGVSDEEFLQEVEAIQTNFFEKYSGYIDSEFLKDKDNQWIKITHWSSMEEVQHVSQAMRGNPVAQSFMQKVSITSCDFYEKMLQLE